uniref:Vitellogenin n=2 Tax=Romanomermis culicivorax TaxID=13658 RepID=A0A915J908_ROMCU
PKKVRVVTANPKYQITCWQAPQRGSPEIYFLRIINERINAARPQYRMDVKSSKMDNECAITHWSGKVGDHLSMLVSANTTDDQATSDPVPFVIEEEKCKREIRKSSTYGDTYWNETAISAKVGVPCPYGPPGRFMERYCMFDVQLKKPYWQNTEQPVECETKVSTGYNCTA